MRLRAKRPAKEGCKTSERMLRSKKAARGQWKLHQCNAVIIRGKSKTKKNRWDCAQLLPPFPSYLIIHTSRQLAPPFVNPHRCFPKERAWNHPCFFVVSRALKKPDAKNKCKKGRSIPPHPSCPKGPMLPTKLDPLFLPMLPQLTLIMSGLPNKQTNKQTNKQASKQTNQPTKPNQTKPNQAKPNQTKPKQNKQTNKQTTTNKQTNNKQQTTTNKSNNQQPKTNKNKKTQQEPKTNKNKKTQQEPAKKLGVFSGEGYCIILKLNVTSACRIFAENPQPWSNCRTLDSCPLKAAWRDRPRDPRTNTSLVNVAMAGWKMNAELRTDVFSYWNMGDID